MTETWRVIPNFPRYEASTEGNIRNKATKNTIGYVNNKESLMCCLTVKGKTVRKLAKVLVATTFIPNPDNYPFVYNIDKDQKNIAVSNLMWSKRIVNKSGEDNYKRVLTEYQVLRIYRGLFLGVPVSYFVNLYKVKNMTIYSIKYGTNWAYLNLKKITKRPYKIKPEILIELKRNTNNKTNRELVQEYNLPLSMIVSIKKGDYDRLINYYLEDIEDFS